MNHQTYEDWVFKNYSDNEETMASEQVQSLEEHLQNCESCRMKAEAWEHIETNLLGANMVGPRPGFVQRWQANLQAERQKLHQRQTAMTLVFSAAGIAVLAGLLLFLVWPWLRSPNVILWTMVYRMFTVYAYIEVAQGVFGTLFQTVSGFIPLTWWVIFMGLVSELGVLWIVSYRILTNPRRILR